MRRGGQSHHDGTQGGRVCGERRRDVQPSCRFAGGRRSESWRLRLAEWKFVGRNMKFGMEKRMYFRLRHRRALEAFTLLSTVKCRLLRTMRQDVDVRLF
jgi:hypothetical protein